MEINRQPINIRAKQIGVLLRGARLTAQKNILECADYLNIDQDQFEYYEYGEQSPSLPELELLAIFLDVPVNYFWGKEVKMKLEEEQSEIDVSTVIGIRQRIIGALIRQERNNQNLSLDELATKVGIDQQLLAQYELGEKPIPVTLLESFGKVLNKSVDDFKSKELIKGNHLERTPITGLDIELPQDIRDFINKPVNIPYIELAMRLSEMPVEKLRMVAEGLLEITL